MEGKHFIILYLHHGIYICQYGNFRYHGCYQSWGEYIVKLFEAN